MYSCTVDRQSQIFVYLAATFAAKNMKVDNKKKGNDTDGTPISITYGSKFCQYNILSRTGSKPVYSTAVHKTSLQNRCAQYSFQYNLSF